MIKRNTCSIDDSVVEYIMQKIAAKMSIKNIEKTSPLYEYWNSEQTEKDNGLRLSKIEPNNGSTYLYKNEPYKWENLYQSVIREIQAGDNQSMKALFILLDMLRPLEKEKVINCRC